jgi:hypothetical protein
VGRVARLYDGASDELQSKWLIKRIVGEINATCPCTSAAAATSSIAKKDGGVSCSSVLANPSTSSSSSSLPIPLYGAQRSDTVDKKSSPCEMCARSRVTQCYHRTVLGIMGREGMHPLVQSVRQSIDAN